jgi:hypothetical protein
MHVKRTAEEKAAALLMIQRLQATAEWAVYCKEVLRIKDAIASGMHREVGDQLSKSAGLLHGIDLALTIDTFLNNKAA